MAVDVVGYSRLMGADEERTLAALKAIRRELGATPRSPSIARARDVVWGKVRTKGGEAAMKLILVWLTCAVVVVMSSASSFAIPINETEFFRQSVPNLTTIQKGTLFLCEGQNVTFGMGSCSDRNATTSDAVVFNQIGPNTLSVIMQSDFDPGERNPPPADLLELPIPFLLPFVSVSEPTGNEEHGNQTYIYTPDVGQPGYAFSNNNRVTWEITSDAPEPSTFLLLCSGLLAAIPVAKRSRIKKLSASGKAGNDA